MSLAASVGPNANRHHNSHQNSWCGFVVQDLSPGWFSGMVLRDGRVVDAAPILKLDFLGETADEGVPLIHERDLKAGIAQMKSHERAKR